MSKFDSENSKGWKAVVGKGGHDSARLCSEKKSSVLRT